ncbi:MAG: HEAT repeat domain-containing protein [Planctomycetota bacterium]
MPRRSLSSPAALIVALIAVSFVAVACAGRGARGSALRNTSMAQAAADAPPANAGNAGNDAPVDTADPVLRDRVATIARQPVLSDLPVLRAALASTDPDVRRLAVRGLALIGSNSVIADLLRVSRSDPSPHVANTAANALRTWPVELVEQIRLATDPVQQHRDEQFETEIARRDAGTIRRMQRQHPPVDEAQMIAWASDLDGDVGFWVENTKIELIKDHAPIGHPLGYNGQANAGELLEYRLTITNASLEARLSSSAFCYTYDPWITVINRELMLPVMRAGETKALPDSLLLLVAADAPESHTARLFLEIGDTRLDEANGGRPVYRAFDVSFTNPGLGRVEFSFSTVDDDSWGESDGNGNRMAEWGERVELTAHVKNFGADTMRDTHLELSSLSSLVSVRPSVTAPVGNIPPGGRAPLSGTFSVRMASGYSGTFEVPMQLKLRVPLPDTQSSDQARHYVNPEAANTTPTRYYTFTQDVTLHIGSEEGATLQAAARIYQPFDPARLLKLFVLGDDRNAQTDWLLDTEARFMDARDTATLDAQAR